MASVRKAVAPSHPDFKERSKSMSAPSATSLYPKSAQTYLTKDDHDRLAAIAARDNRSVASYMRILLLDHIRSQSDATQQKQGRAAAHAR